MKHARLIHLIFLFMFAQIERDVGLWRAFSWRGNESSETGAFEQRMEVDSEGKRKEGSPRRCVCLLMFCPFMLFTVQIACCAIDYPLRYRQMHVQDIWPVETRSK